MRSDMEETHTCTQLKVLTESFALLSESVELESRRTRQKPRQRMEDMMQEANKDMADDLREVLAQLKQSAGA